MGAGAQARALWDGGCVGVLRGGQRGSNWGEGMIWESSDWKRPLLRMAGRIDAARYATSLNERRLATAERDVILGCFTIRKLLHSGPKLTDQSRATKVSAMSFPNIKHVDSQNWHHLDELYDFKKGSQSTLPLEPFCNQFIHSFVLALDCREDGGLSGFLVSSDQKRNANLFSIKAEDVAKVFQTIGSSYPSRIIGTREETTGDWKYSAD